MILRTKRVVKVHNSTDGDMSALLEQTRADYLFIREEGEMARGNVNRYDGATR